MKNILLAVDGSENSLRAAEKTLSLTKLHSDLKFTVIFVAPTCFDLFPEPGICAWINRNELEKDIQSRAAIVSEKVSEIFKAEGLSPQFILGRGNTAETICKTAEEGNFDMIVIGSRGFGDIKSALLGSVSHKVLHCSHCPVLVVK
ncbi:UspA domain protein [Desulfofarcimen acetoxidans DSM 771]|jgi:nucleotide-binding universal stress UspA family protein|uniref:UspA domain protein n=1 Tax=Desulfofarcimen acetoxidans (strain ATCC 49208 / DSM 771 / KCTC 5769 / VKM B-1644 / 5575) TaxID=485916 RepID=C8VXF5_DESAS|nr:universal stress protein [Desulfofarcimen acetoxidans]ACV64551.1 UspA domain protein [Desulfofarcimen acetoxidans DSM 771]